MEHPPIPHVATGVHRRTCDGQVSVAHQRERESAGVAASSDEALCALSARTGKSKPTHVHDGSARRRRSLRSRRGTSYSHRSSHLRHRSSPSPRGRLTRQRPISKLFLTRRRLRLLHRAVRPQPRHFVPCRTGTSYQQDRSCRAALQSR